jgi:type II secretory pathway pseudopilin PulG
MFRACSAAAGRHGHRGFTYVGLLLAVALAGVGLAAAGQVWSTAAQREREARLLAVGAEFQRALQSYYDASPGVKVPPETLEALLDDRRVPVTRRHLRRIYEDPITGRREWGLVKLGGRIVGVHSLSDARPFRGLHEGKERITYRDWVFQINVESPRREASAEGGPSAPAAPLATSGLPATPSGGSAARPITPAVPLDEAAARRRQCSERHSAERGQCLGLLAGDRATYGRCLNIAANRLTACLDGGEGPPMPPQ